MSIIERKIVPDSIVYSDGWKGYSVLDVSANWSSRIGVAQRGFQSGRQKTNA